jgi:undecaprenyl-diphosphatase
MLIVAGTIPAAAAGVLFEDAVENTLRSPQIIGVTLIAMALLLVVAEIVGHRKKSLSDLSWGDAIAIGVAQAIAIIPGVSRSGSTITAGLFLSLKRDDAARFSFYLSAPIIAGAVGKKAIDVMQTGLPSDQVAAFITGIISSGVVGYLAIAFLMRYLQTHNTFLFVVYRIVLGIVVLLAFSN